MNFFSSYKKEIGTFSLFCLLSYFSVFSYRSPSIKDCDHECPMQMFINLTKPVIPVDWLKECGLSEHPMSSPNPNGGGTFTIFQNTDRQKLRIITLQSIITDYSVSNVLNPTLYS